MAQFIGRSTELNQLIRFTKKKTASFIVVKGRRRIGKSRLITEFSKSFDQFYSFSGLPPVQGVKRDQQLEEFSRQMSREFRTPHVKYNDWGDIFWALGDRLKSGKILLLFDEISWMGNKDETFLGKIKNFWDMYIKNNDKIVFVICGSASSWIEKNILSSTGFLGRISFVLTLEELSLQEARDFWPKNISSFEIIKILSITGGVPKYLEEIQTQLPAEENIKNLCFTKGGFLVNEFDHIFSDIFLRKSKFYKEIVRALVDGPKDQNAVCQSLKIGRQGRISEYLYELELAGFVTKDYAWNLNNGQDLKIARYRLSDNYVRFYLKYIDKNKTKIERNTYAPKSSTALSQWSGIIGLQFENLVLKNRVLVHRLLNIQSEDIISENPFFQQKTLRNQGCQIDYMIQTKFQVLYICEIKFSKNKIGCDVIPEVQKKIDRLKRPKSFSCRPILIHVNGVTTELQENDYFAAIIDFTDLLS